MKRTAIDRVVGFFSPIAEVKRIQARMARDLALRAYDAAQSYSTSDWVSANKSGANSEIGAARATLVQKSRDLSRNSPYAVRAEDVIVANVVGSGIVATIKHKDEKKSEELNLNWKKHSESTLIDSAGRLNFYGLQALTMRTIVRDGESLSVLQNIQRLPVVKMLEADFINSTKDDGNVIQGVELDKNGVRVKYHLFKSHPGEKNATDDTITLPAEDVCHSFELDRPGQQRGVPWSHAAIERLKDLEDYQNASLIAKKVSACLMGVVTTSGSTNALDSATIKAKREAQWSMTPASVRYLKDGESITWSNPPRADGYEEFVRETLRAIAAAFRVTYEAMTGDYSQVNFSSGRMGQNEFRRNVDAWRWNMLIPQFCQPVMNRFLKLQGVKLEDVTVEWTPPSFVMIDPTKELNALKTEVRAGFKSWPEAVRELGRDPDKTLKEITEYNKKFDDNKLTFDSDARRTSGIGFAQAGDSLPKLNPDADYLQSDEENKGEEGNKEASKAPDESGVSADDAE